MKYPLIESGDWKTELVELASNGKGIRLKATFRFDGNGNVISRFYVNVLGKETPYEKHNAAAEAYNIAYQKAKK